jgi:ABC-2 type transport system ATP-binding protein
VLRVDRLSVAYGTRTAVRDVSFTIPAGRILGLVGPNGAGKTSIAETVAGLRDAVSGGSVRVCGRDPRRDRAAVRGLVGVQLQEESFPSRATVGELCDLYEAIYGLPGATRPLLERFGLADRRRSLISALSGGLRQRLALVLAQIGDVKLVILDELTTGLDPEQRRGTWQAVLDLAAGGVAVLLASHSMDEVEALCAEVLVLKDGEVAACGSPAAIVAEYGGSAVFTVDTDPTGAAADHIRRLGLPQVSAAPGSGGLRFAGRFPQDFDRLVEAATAAGLRPSAVGHRTPSLEDAYLNLVADRGAGGGARPSESPDKEAVT